MNISLKSLFPKAAGVMANYIEKDAGFIVGPIAMVVGFILNLVFTVVFKVTAAHSLGISIIFLTIIIRSFMLPLGFKQQKSMIGMQKLTPEIDKIKTKYGDTKDPELNRKMNMEIQALYSKNKVSMFGGCLPLLVTLPIFFALTYVMRQTYLYITPLGKIYNDIATLIPQTNPDSWTVTLVDIVKRLIPPGGMEGFDLANITDFAKAINKFTASDIKAITDQAVYHKDALVSLFAEKANIETFFGINLLFKPEFSFANFQLSQIPALIIPLLSGITQFLTFWVSEKTMPTPAAGQAATQQKMMKYIMPLMMVYFTMQISGGVGLYWTVSNVYQIFQQYFITRYYKKAEPAAVEASKTVINAKSKSKK